MEQQQKWYISDDILKVLSVRTLKKVRQELEDYSVQIQDTAEQGQYEEMLEILTEVIQSA
jgi:hypothetical protein